MADTCDIGRVECEECGRARCRRCGRCLERLATGEVPGTYTYYCPSWRCGLAKRLRRLWGRPYSKQDTPPKD